MKREMLRTTIAAATVVAFVGVAHAGMDGANKVSMNTDAQPAAKVVKEDQPQLATVKTGEKAANRCETPATQPAGEADEPAAVQDKGQKCY